MNRYFVTGAQGFVGRYVVSHLLTSDRTAEIAGIGRSPRLANTFTHLVTWGRLRVPAPLPESMREPLASAQYRYIALDLRCRTELLAALKELRPHVVIHLASGLRDDPPSSLIASNVEATVALLETLASSGIPIRKVVLCSTGGVYGAPAELPIREEAACNPIDPYSISKRIAEECSRDLAQRYRIPVVWARLFNLVGPGQDERHICGELAAQAAAIAEEAVRPVLSAGVLDTTRDFIDVRDAASALVLIAEKGEDGGIYNVASGRETSMDAVLKAILESAGLNRRVRIEQNQLRSAGIPRHFASIERLHALGFRCAYTLTESIRDVLDYYRALARGSFSRPAVDQAAEQLALRKSELEEARTQRDVLLAEDLAEVRRDVAVTEDESKEAEGRLQVLLAGTRKEELQALQAEIMRSEADRAFLQEQIHGAIIVAPAAGTVATPARFLRELRGQFVKRGDLIAKVYDLTAMTSEIVISEKEIADIRLGQPVVLKARAYPDLEFRGEVTAIATAVQSGNVSVSGTQSSAAPTLNRSGMSGRTILITTRIDNSSLLLKPDMTGQAKIYCGKRRIIDIMTRRLVRTVKVEFWSWW